MKHLTITAALAAATILSGCTTTFGVPFNNTAVRQLTPGVSTKAELIAKVGPQVRPEIITLKKDAGGKELANPLIAEATYYYFMDKSAVATKPEVYATRSVWVDTIDSTVMAYNYSSTFAEDSTDFDESKIAAIVKGRSTEQDVIALLGQPGSRSLYPYAKEAGGSRLTYLNIAYSKNSNKSRTKNYTVYLDAARVVTDFDLRITEK